MTTKTCRRCDRQLPMTAFNRRTDSKDGRQSYCRSCARVALQERGPIPRAGAR